MIGDNPEQAVLMLGGVSNPAYLPAPSSRGEQIDFVVAVRPAEWRPYAQYIPVSTRAEIKDPAHRQHCDRIAEKPNSEIQ